MLICDSTGATSNLEALFVSETLDGTTLAEKFLQNSSKNKVHNYVLAVNDQINFTILKHDIFPGLMLVIRKVFKQILLKAFKNTIFFLSTKISNHFLTFFRDIVN